MIPANSFLSLLNPTAAPAAKGDAPAAAGDFSALFAALALQEPGKGAVDAETAPEGAEAKADPATLLALTLAASGKPAAQPGKTGKILPLPLPPGNPVPAAESDADAATDGLPATEDEQPSATLLAEPVSALPIPAPPALPVVSANLDRLASPSGSPEGYTGPATGAGTTAAAPLPATAPATPRASVADGRASTPVATPVQPAAQDNTPRVTLQVAAQPLAVSGKDAAAPAPVAQQAALAPQLPVAAMVADRAPAEARPRPAAKPAPAAAVLAQPSTPQAAPLLADAATPFPLMPVQAAPQAPATAGQDLAAIVDRLSAAREALAPANASLSIDHAEFGEISLRFDQRADGALSVQLAAATPEAHRAISAAVGAEGGQFLSADGQPQPQTPQPQQAAPQSGNGTATGAFTERDARGGQQPQRQDTSARQQQAQRQPAATPHQPQGDGIFA